MEIWPQILYHKDLAPEGKLFQNEGALPKDMAGWVDLPAKFDPSYVEPPASDIEEVGEDAAARGFVLVEYPAHLYQKGDPEHPREVKTPEAHAALEAAEPGVWKDTYDPAAWDEHADTAPAKPAKSAKAAKAKAAPVAEAPAAPVAGGGVVLTDAQVAAFRKANIGVIAEQLEAITNPAALQALQASEEENPKKRASVVKAIKARIAALSVADGE